MAASRPQRANAGNKIAQLLEDEQEDDFYKTSVSLDKNLFGRKIMVFPFSTADSRKSKMIMTTSKYLTF